MVPLFIAYIVGTLLGEVMLLAWWAMQQKTQVTPRDYFREKWATALFSGALATCGSVLWAEGSLVKHLGSTAELTIGYSFASGAAITFFAHSIVWTIGRIWGLKPPPSGDPTQGDQP